MRWRMLRRYGQIHVHMIFLNCLFQYSYVLPFTKLLVIALIRKMTIAALHWKLMLSTPIMTIRSISSGLEAQKLPGPITSGHPISLMSHLLC